MGPDTAIPAGARDESERRWSTTRRAADVAWVIALLMAIPLSPVARFYLLSWPGLVEWVLVVVIAAGVLVHTVADGRLRAIHDAALRDAGGGPSPDGAPMPPGSRMTTAAGWTVVVLLLPVLWVCLIDPLIATVSFDWGPTGLPSGLEPVLIATFLICPYLVGLLVWWLARGVRSPAERLIAASVVACAAGLLVYGSLGYLSPALSRLL